MDTDIVIIGAGHSGTLAANRLRAYCDARDVRITVIDGNDTRDHEIELLTALGLYGPHVLQPPEHLQLRDGIEFRVVEAATADLDRTEICFSDGTTLGYDVLVVATGTPATRRGTFVADSPGLGDEHGRVAVDSGTRRSRTHPRVYAIGSAADGPRPTGPVIHAQAEKLARAVREYLAAGPPSPHGVNGRATTAVS